MLTPCDFLDYLEAATGFEPVYNGFADRCLTTWLCRQEKQSDRINRMYRIDYGFGFSVAACNRKTKTKES